MLYITISITVLSGILAFWKDIFTDQPVNANVPERVSLAKYIFCILLLVTIGLQVYSNWEEDRQKESRDVQQKAREDKEDAEKEFTQAKEHEKEVMIQYEAYLKKHRPDSARYVKNPEDDLKFVLPDKNQFRKIKSETIRPKPRITEPEPVPEEAIFDNNRSNIPQKLLTTKEKEDIADELRKLILVYHEGNPGIPVIIQTDPDVYFIAADLLLFLKEQGYKKAAVAKLAYGHTENTEKIFNVEISEEAARLPTVNIYKIVRSLTK